jgi:hypothetical protein
LRVDGLEEVRRPMGAKAKVMSPDYGCCSAAEIAASDIELSRLPTPHIAHHSVLGLNTLVDGLPPIAFFLASTSTMLPLPQQVCAGVDMVVLVQWKITYLEAWQWVAVNRRCTVG